MMNDEWENTSRCAGRRLRQLIIHHSSFIVHHFPLPSAIIKLIASTDGVDGMLKDKKLAVLGCGKLGETLIKGLIEAGVIEVTNVTVTAGHQQRLDQMRERFGVAGTLSNSM